MNTTSNPTRGQIERNLTQRIQNLYQEKLGQRPEKVICQFFDEKLAIVLEKIITRSEQLMLNNQQHEFAEKLRSQLDDALKSQLQELIEEIVGVSVKVLLSDTDLRSGVSGIIAVLDNTPPVRNPESIPKLKKDKIVDEDNE
jgi:uncharacterized protein YbcI